MKKIIFALLFSLVPVRLFADTPSAQLLASLLQHVTAVNEFISHGHDKLEFLDGIIQIGHYKKDYILALDGGVSNSLAPDEQGHLAGTYGVHFHIISFVNNYFNVNPALAQTLTLLEVNPRYSYDADVHHGVLGFTFGARIPFGGN